MSAAKPAGKEISPKLRKTIDRLQSRIKESADYEVHQELKAIADRYSPPLFFEGLISGRYLRMQGYDSAVQLLYLGGELLLENGLGASGVDITITMIEVYNTAHMKPDSPNRGPYSPLLTTLRPSANSTTARNDRSI
jgi:hypothetical protein